ncbi:hypothetical protein HYSC106933_07050 [Hydrogenibacillus schlegelii]
MIDCPKCRGNGEELCRMCGGTGEGEAGEGTCPYCFGFGIVSCSVCGGTGALEDVV